MMQSHRSGFTLMEMLIAISVLAVAATILMGTQSTGTRMLVHANDLSTVVMLTRAKMQDIEYEVLKDGFVENHEESKSGNFSDEGIPTSNGKPLLSALKSRRRRQQLVTAMEEQLFGSEEEGGSISGAGIAVGQAVPLLITMLPA
jgi:prepilin-type N-terminal cleavage/methylation domain-containing protein